MKPNLPSPVVYLLGSNLSVLLIQRSVIMKTRRDGANWFNLINAPNYLSQMGFAPVPPPSFQAYFNFMDMVLGHDPHNFFYWNLISSEFVGNYFSSAVFYIFFSPLDLYVMSIPIRASLSQGKRWLESISSNAQSVYKQKMVSTLQWADFLYLKLRLFDKKGNFECGSKKIEQ